MIVQTVLDRQLTAIAFASDAPIIFTGDDNGVMNVYKLFKITGASSESIHPVNKQLTPQQFEYQADVLKSIIDSRVTNGAE